MHAFAHDPASSAVFTTTAQQVMRLRGSEVWSGLPKLTQQVGGRVKAHTTLGTCGPDSCVVSWEGTSWGH